MGCPTDGDMSMMLRSQDFIHDSQVPLVEGLVKHTPDERGSSLHGLLLTVRFVTRCTFHLFSPLRPTRNFYDTDIVPNQIEIVLGINT